MVVVGWRISYVLENKLNNISINIPPIKLSTPNINLKIQKSKDSDEYQAIMVEKFEPEMKSTQPLTQSDTGIIKTTSQNVQYPNEDDIFSLDDSRVRIEPPKSCGCGIPQSQPNTVCGCTNPEDKKLYNLPPESKSSHQEFDPSMHYRQHQEYVKTYLEDPRTRGYNINDTYAPVSSIGVDKDEPIIRYPKPNGFIFNS